VGLHKMTLVRISLTIMTSALAGLAHSAVRTRSHVTLSLLLY